LLSIIQPAIDRLIHDRIHRRVFDACDRFQQTIFFLSNIDPNLWLGWFGHAQMGLRQLTYNPCFNLVNLGILPYKGNCHIMKVRQKKSRTDKGSGLDSYGVLTMITLTPDEVALLKSLLIALRGIKTRDLDKALVILSKHERRQKSSSGLH